MITNNAWIIDIGNGKSDNIIISFNYGTTGGIFIQLFDKTSSLLLMETNIKFTLINKWQYVAFIFDYPIFWIYLDGTLMASDLC